MLSLLPFVLAVVPFQQEAEEALARARFAEALAALSTRPLEGPIAEDSPVTPPELDYRQYDVELRWDFRSGVVDGQGTLVVRAQPGQAPTYVALLVDNGVTVSVSDAVGPLAVSRQPLGGTDYLTFAPRTSLSAGADSTFTLSWSGTLNCGVGFGGTTGCDVGAKPLVWLNHGSGIPALLDSASGPSSDVVSRRWTVRTPKGFAVWLAADQLTDSETATERVTTWQTRRPVALALSSFLFTGTALQVTPSAVTASPVVDAASAQQPTVATWTAAILPDMKARFGEALSEGAAQVIIPRASTFNGTASYAMTLLNETYDSLGATLHEEIWAHENIHQHFAVRGYPTDIAITGLMTEGITTLMQLDFTHRGLTGLERERALGLRQREFALQLDYLYPQLASVPVRLPSAVGRPNDSYEYTVWGYFRGASTLEVLRVWLTEPVFEQGLQRYLAACDVGPCDSWTFQQELGDVSGKDLAPFFAEWVDAARIPHVTVGFTPRAGEVEVDLSQATAGHLPVEVWLEHEDGAVERQPWVLTSAGETRVFPVSSAVRAVRLNPRLDGAVRSVSATAGDVDFDGEVDGFDVIACARVVGQGLRTLSPHQGIWLTNLDFDARCDADGNAQVSEAEVTALPFNTLRSAP